MEYEYMLYTWGGFYSPEHQKKHGESDGYHYFSLKEKRDKYLLHLQSLEKALNANHLIYITGEGYHVREKVILHRVLRFRVDTIHTETEMPPGTTYAAAKFIMSNKWYPGHNDYPFGEDANYDEVEIIQEWITGAFDYDEDEPKCESCHIVDMFDELENIFQKKGKK